MQKLKRTIVVLAVLLVLVSGAVTAYAMASEAGMRASAEYAAEERAVENYYEDLVLAEDTEMM